MAVIMLGWQRDTVKVMGWKLACRQMTSQWPLQNFESCTERNSHCKGEQQLPFQADESGD
jgi:hypothetical protein